MVKVIYKKEIGVNMVGEIEYTVLPTCPECNECTYSEDTCPFCRMKGVLTKLEYNGCRHPEFLDEYGNDAKKHCGTFEI